MGGQLQRRLVGAEGRWWDASGRISFVFMYRPAGADLTVFGADLVAGRTLTLARWASISPYVGVSGYVSTSHEKTAEYNAATVRTISLKVGLGL